MCRQAIRIDIEETFSRASGNYRLWKSLNSGFAHEYPSEIEAIKKRYRRFVVKEAYWYHQHDKILARAGLRTLLIMGIAFSIFWTALLTLVVTRKEVFALVSAVSVVLIVIIVLYYAVDYSINLSRVVQLGTLILVIGAAMQIESTSGQGRILSEGVFVAYFGLVLIMFGVLILVTAFIGSLSERKILKQWIIRRPMEIGAIMACQAAASLQGCELGIVGGELRHMGWRFLRIAACLEVGLGSSSDELVWYLFRSR